MICIKYLVATLVALLASAMFGLAANSHWVFAISFTLMEYWFIYLVDRDEDQKSEPKVRVLFDEAEVIIPTHMEDWDERFDEQCQPNKKSNNY